MESDARVQAAEERATEAEGYEAATSMATEEAYAIIRAVSVLPGVPEDLRKAAERCLVDRRG